MATPRSADLAAAIIHEPLTLGANSSVMDAIALMSGVRTLCPIDRDHTPENSLHPEARSSCVAVVDNDQVVGILTERDVVRLSAQQQPLDQLLVAEAMAQPVITRRQADLTDLFGTIDLLQHHHIRHLPIIDEQDRLVGLITHESLRQLTRPVDLLQLRLVQEVMTTDVLCASPDSSMLEIARLMADRRVSSVVIVVPGGSPEAPWRRAVGLLTERDLVQFQAVGLSLTATTAQTVMSSPVFTVALDTSLWEVQQIMEQRWIRRVVVAGEHGELLGIITQTSLLQSFNPVDLYTLAETLGKKVKRLETERLALLETRAAALEQQVQERTQTIQMQAERDRLMAGLASQILASLDVQVILDTTVHQVQQILGCDHVSIWRFEPEWATVVVAESTDTNRSFIGERIADTCFSENQAEAYRQGRIRVVPDIYATEMSDCHRDMLTRLQIRAKILVPLLCGDELWGLLNVTEAQPRDWQPAEIDFVRSLSIQLAIALNQASNHEQLQSELHERQQAERQLRQSTERLQEAQRIAHIGNWELNLQHNTLYWSEEVFRLFEIDPQQFGASYQAFLDLVHPDDRTLVDDAYAKHLRDRQPFNLVHRLQLADGRIKYVREQCETIYSADGTPLISQGTVQDITQQQEAEIRRDRAEAALRQVVEGTAAVIGEAFFPALVRHISEALEVRYVSIDQATPDGFQVLAFFADGEFCVPLFLPYEELPCCLESLQTGSCCHPSGVQALYPGNTLFTNLKVDSYLGVRLQNSAGDPIGNLCILDDVPLADPDWARTLLTIFAARAGAELERLMTAQALEQLNGELESRVAERTATLAEREALLQDFLDNANDLIQIADVDTGRLEFVNRAWQEVLGYTAAEVEQLTVLDVLAPDCLTHCRQAMEQMRAGTLTNLEHVELTFVHKLGQPVLLEGSINCRFGVSADGRQQTLSTRAIFRDITAKKAAEQALQKSEIRFRRVFESNVVGMMFTDFSGRISDANDRFLALLGYTRQELESGCCLNWANLTPPEYQAQDQAAIAHLQNHDAIAPWEKVYRHKDGHLVPVLVGVAMLSHEDESCVCVVVDISARKHYETALQESQQFLQTVLDTVPLSVFWKDRSSKYLGANKRFLQDASLRSVSELVGKNDSEMPWSVTEAKAYQADDRVVMKSGEAKLGIIEPQHQQDGTTIWLETNKLPLRNLAGEVIGVLGTYQDITERKNAEIALQRQLAAIEAAVNGIAILENERYLYLNSSHAKMFGYEQAEELIGQSWQMLYIPEELERFDREILPDLLAQKFWRGEVTAVRKDGTTFPEQLSLTLSADNLLICVCEDISERARLDAERQQAQQQLTLTNIELVRATHLKDEFLANMSHELRTPLNAILGMTEALQEENVFGAVNTQQLKALKTVERSGTHLLELINDVLDVAKIEAGQVELDLTPTAIAPLCHSSLAFVKQPSLKKGIQFTVNLPAALPTILLDERRIRQVLINLLNNAVKFTPNGGQITLEVIPLAPVLGSEETPYLRFAVTDTGIGITLADQQRLFQPFVQVDSALNRQYQGTGLGLALVKRIAEMHQGRVGLTSEAGVGSCFTVDLPYAQGMATIPDSNPDSSPGAPESTVATTPATAPLILLAEDNEANISTMVSYLEAKGYRVDIAHNGQEAVDRLQHLAPDLILMDVQMPGMDGLEAIGHIRRDPNLGEVPVIALTSLAMPGDRDRCLAAGATEYLSKPVRLKQLVEMIHTLLLSSLPSTIPDP